MLNVLELCKKVCTSSLFKGAEFVLSIWLVFAHSGSYHILSAKDYIALPSAVVSIPVVYITARFSAAVFERSWVHWIADTVFLIIISLIYLLVICFLISDTKGMEELHRKYFIEQRTPLAQGLIDLNILVALTLIIIILIDIVCTIIWREKRPTKPKQPGKRQSSPTKK